MKKIRFFTSFFFLFFLLVSCTAFPYNTALPVTPTQQIESVEEITTPEAEETIPTEDNTPKTLRIWLPPEFDPNAETDAAAILRARLESFQKRRPDLILEVRIKAVTGEASLLNALIATYNAAPSIMPDLVALQRPDLESAANAGVLHPLEGLTDALDDPDWFPYAQPLAHIQNSAYGLPFASNLLALRYEASEDFPHPSIESLSEEELQILLSEDSAMLSFCFYDEENIEEESFTQLLSFYQSDLFTFTETPNSLPIKWSKDFWDEGVDGVNLGAIPTPTGDVCSLASGWLWTLAGSDPELQPDSVELAEYLSQSDFLAEWTQVTGYIAPRPTAILLAEEQALSLVAQVIPSNEIVEALAEKFNIAIMSVLTDQVDPSVATQGLLESIQ
ncbi:MAG: hypothetical protein HN392_01410 [Anaerolineae bacterium]|jgi:multiple sugar transport system substrate-binding protein|nr:hypothetical protein [Anaerolineae bacterium]MBT7074645.1 hypothetical protein [Anaerolineae bacterium]MBT7781687.1 hypothetical protein [Anaerolineae bacterium]